MCSPLHKGLYHNDQHQDVASNTSYTFSESWDPSAAENPNGVDVPLFLGNLLGIDFLPFSSTIQEEEINVPPMDVPHSVEISTEEPPLAVEPLGGEDESDGTTKCRERVVSPQPPPEETAELLELLIQSNKKKKKAAKGFKAAARSVLQRVKSGKKAPSGSSGSSKRKNKNKKHAPNTKTYKNELVVDTARSHVGQQQGHTGWISPTATADTDGTDSPISCGANTKELAEEIHNHTLCLREKAQEQEGMMKTTHAEIEGLQSQLSVSISKYQEQLAQLQTTQEQLAELAVGTKQSAEEHVISKEGLRRVFKRSESGSFMRVHDLDLSTSLRGSSDESESLSSLSQSGHGPQKTNQIGVPTPDFLLMDHYLLEITRQLMGLGFDLATDETDRFTPSRDTAKLLSRMPSSKTIQNAWPVQPWTPAWDNNVLVWTGKVNHDGFGHTWPVVKGRAILHTSAQNVLEYMWDSSLVPRYNPLCQGRSDLYTLQDDVHTSEKESPFGFAGCAKIVRSLNKHRLLPKAIEMKILMHARPLEHHKGSYILVSRSVWENDSATLDCQAAKSVIRTEMLLGCSIMRAIDENTCELTQMTHVHSPGVPEMLARRASPGQCSSLMKTLQGLFDS